MLETILFSKTSVYENIFALPDKLLNDLWQLIHGHFHFADQRIKYAPGVRDVVLINQFLHNHPDRLVTAFGPGTG